MKEDIVHKCTLEREGMSVISVITTTHDYAVIKESFFAVTFINENEELAKERAMLLRTEYPKESITIEGNKVQVIMDFLETEITEPIKEMVMNWIADEESRGFICTIE